MTALVSIETPVLSPGLKASIDKAVSDIPAGQRGHLSVGVSLQGAEVGVASRTRFGFLVGGYAKRLWGGGFEAGARVTRSW